MLPVDQRREWIKSRRRKRKVTRGARLRRQMFRMLLLMTILAIGFLGFSYLPWSVNDSDNQLIVKGNHFTSTEQIRQALMDSFYKPVYELDPKVQERKVEALETVRNAFVRRYAFPKPHIVIEVLEEQPWATFGFNPELPPHSVIAESGRIIPLKKFPSITSPALKVYAPANLKMTAPDVKQWATWINYIEKQSRQPVQFVDMRKPFDVNVRTTELTLKIGIPDTGLTQRLGRLTSILSTLKEYGDSLDYVDLALDNNIPIKVSKKADTKTSSAKQHSAEPDAANTSVSSAATAVPM